MLFSGNTFCLNTLFSTAPPVGPVFGTVNTSVSDDGAMISWEYFGHHKNVFVEYIVENSKGSSLISHSNLTHNLLPNLTTCSLLFSHPQLPILGKEDWKKELVNGSHSHMIKGLKPGTSYRVRVVARDPSDLTVHSADEVLVTVPGEAACLRVH